MRFGITTPIVTLHPEINASWEETGTIEDLSRIVRAAEQFGFHHVTCSEHVAIPTDIAPVRGGRYWDPLATFGYLSAQTTRIRFATHVLVLGYHHPLEIAKRYGTLDLVSDGRLILGVGVGSLQEEFELLGAPFQDRGARADEALAALRASLSRLHPEFHGTYYNYEQVVVDPCATQPSIPLWIGGRTARSLQRAIALGDGWIPFGLGLEELSLLLDRVSRRRAPGPPDPPRSNWSYRPANASIPSAILMESEQRSRVLPRSELRSCSYESCIPRQITALSSSRP